MDASTYGVEREVALVADRNIAFTTSDVVDQADLEGHQPAIQRALTSLTARRVLLEISDSKEEPGPNTLYINRNAVYRWWVRNTLQWATSGLECLTPLQLATSMSRAFLGLSQKPWDEPPASILTEGMGWAMVATGSVLDTFVSPWAWALHSNPAMYEFFRSTFYSPQAYELFGRSDDKSQLQLPGGSTSGNDNDRIDNAVELALNALGERDRDILIRRRGLDNSPRMTLESIGLRYNLTRERIRQIEKRALRKLRAKSFRQVLWEGFARAFVENRGSLLIEGGSIGPRRKLLHEVIDLSAMSASALGIELICMRTSARQQALLQLSSEPEVRAYGQLRFLSNRDSDMLRTIAKNVAKKQQAQETRKYRSNMLVAALRSLGRAAHYEEIAIECERLFPEKRISTRNWHAALSAESSGRLGIVWIGSKGMYGLKEHGYSRPATGLFASVAQIVESKYNVTGRPVKFDAIVAELGRQRKEVKRSSVAMALGINEKVQVLDGNRYIPKQPIADNPTDERSNYDLNAGFKAFTS